MNLPEIKESKPCPICGGTKFIDTDNGLVCADCSSNTAQDDGKQIVNDD